MSNDNNSRISPSENFRKRHPAGLWVLFTTEMWERFAFYAMRAILVLYLVDVSTSEQTPGFGWTEADAYKLYGWYTGLVYLAPLLGGWIADRFWGQRHCVILGGALMALGEFFLAATEFIRIGGGVKITMDSDPTALITFYIGLALMILGNGFFKPCISVMVGQLYAPGDRMRDSAFSIFYMGINIGAFLSPLVAGTVAEKYGYHLGFIIAGLGMICGLISFTVFGRSYLKGIGSAPVKHDPSDQLTPEERDAREKAAYEQTRPLTKQDWDRMYVIVILSIFVIAFWITFEQAGSSLNIFAKVNTDRGVQENIVQLSKSNFLTAETFKENEDFDSFKGLVLRVRSLEGQLEQERKRKDTGQTEETKPENFGERFKRLFAFQTKKDDRPMEEQIVELKEIATGLNERLRSSQDDRVQIGLDALNKVIESDGTTAVQKLLEKLDVLAKESTDTARGVEDAKKSIAEDTDYAVIEQKLIGAIKQLNVTPKDGSELAGEIAAKDKEIAQNNRRRNNLLEAITSVLAFEQGNDGHDIQTGLIDMDRAEKKFEAYYVPGKTAYTFPASWYQSVNACGIVIFAPIFAFMWIFLAARGLEPSTPYKFALGLILVSASFFIMIPGAVEAKETAGKAGAYWLILCYLLATWGELCLSPVGLSMVTKLAPARYASLFMGVWFMASSIAYILSGYAASYFGSGEGVDLFFGPEKGLADFFLLMAVIPMVIGFIALALAPKLKKMMHGIN